MDHNTTYKSRSVATFGKVEMTEERSRNDLRVGVW